MKSTVELTKQGVRNLNDLGPKKKGPGTSQEPGPGALPLADAAQEKPLAPPIASVVAGKA